MKIRIIDTKTGKKVKLPVGVDFSVSSNGRLLLQAEDGYDFDHILFYADDLEDLLENTVTEFAFRRNPKTGKWIWADCVIND